MMDQTHIGYTYWQEPPRNTMPRVDVIQIRGGGDGRRGRRAESSRAAGRARAGLPSGRRRAALPAFDPTAADAIHVDVYNRGTTPFTFTAKAARAVGARVAGVGHGEQASSALA